MNVAAVPRPPNPTLLFLPTWRGLPAHAQPPPRRLARNAVRRWTSWRARHRTAPPESAHSALQARNRQEPRGEPPCQRYAARKLPIQRGSARHRSARRNSAPRLACAGLRRRARPRLPLRPYRRRRARNHAPLTRSRLHKQFSAPVMPQSLASWCTLARPLAATRRLRLPGGLCQPRCPRRLSPRAAASASAPRCPASSAPACPSRPPPPASPAPG